MVVLYFTALKKQHWQLTNGELFKMKTKVLEIILNALSAAEDTLYDQVRERDHRKCR